jgi:hypothetical protein
MAPHYFGKLDLDFDPRESEKLDLDPNQSQNSRAVEAQMKPCRMNAHNGGGEAQNGALKDLLASDRRFLVSDSVCKY